MPRQKRRHFVLKTTALKRWRSEGSGSNGNSVSKTLSPNADHTETKQSARCHKQESENINVPQKTEDVIESPNYIIIDVNMLSKLFENLLCSTCKNSSLRVILGACYGFSQKVKVTCDICNQVESETHTSIKSDVALRQPYDINVRVVQAFLSFGRGYSALAVFCMYTNMHLMSSRSFNDCKKILHKSISNSSAKNMQKDRNEVRREHGVSDDDDIANISVSFDGTWLTRGHTSQIGVGCVIDILTGYVVDYEVMSKHCTKCEYAKSDLGEKSAEYNMWYEGHKSSCSINHTGSSGAMEMEAAYKLWSRSEKLGLRYTTILSDGDSKTSKHLNDKNVYGSNIMIKKEECVNHVIKKLGTALRKTVQEWRAKCVTLGGKSHGSLKEDTIKKLTRYYQNAVLRNKGNINSMKTAIYATLLHNSSADDKPQHHKCPGGKDSWCFYQAAMANGETPGSHKINIKTPVNVNFLPKIMPIYQRLASNELLERCMRCLTQNSNECLHSLIWSKCSKENSASLCRVNIAVADAVSVFNVATFQSLESIQAENNIIFNKQSRYLAMWRDYRRVYQRKRKRSIVYEMAQKKIKLARKRRQYFNLRKEGLTYKAGSF